MENAYVIRDIMDLCVNVSNSKLIKYLNLNIIFVVRDCPDTCINGECEDITGICICDEGFTGTTCNGNTAILK